MTRARRRGSRSRAVDERGNARRRGSSERTTAARDQPTSAAPSGDSSDDGRKTLTQRIAVIGAVITVLVGGTTLIDWVNSKVGSREPPTIDARIVHVERQPRASLLDVLRDTNRSPSDYRPEQLRQVGTVFVVTVRLRGGQGMRFPLRWFMVDADTGKRLPGPSYDQVPAIFQPRNQDHSRTWPVWVPDPPRAGRYRVVFVLDNAKREPVSQRATRPFSYPEGDG